MRPPTPSTSTVTPISRRATSGEGASKSIGRGWARCIHGLSPSRRGEPTARPAARLRWLHRVRRLGVAVVIAQGFAVFALVACALLFARLLLGERRRRRLDGSLARAL